MQTHICKEDYICESTSHKTFLLNEDTHLQRRLFHANDICKSTRQRENQRDDAYVPFCFHSFDVWSSLIGQNSDSRVRLARSLPEYPSVCSPSTAQSSSDKTTLLSLVWIFINAILASLQGHVL